jgi:predicted membrane chloride channel (bestrophin family)
MQSAVTGLIGTGVRYRASRIVCTPLSLAYGLRREIAYAFCLMLEASIQLRSAK